MPVYPGARRSVRPASNRPPALPASSAGATPSPDDRISFRRRVPGNPRAIVRMSCRAGRGTLQSDSLARGAAANVPVRHGATYGCRWCVKVASRLRWEADGRESVDKSATLPEGRHGHVPAVPTRWVRDSYRGNEQSNWRPPNSDQQLSVCTWRTPDEHGAEP